MKEIRYLQAMERHFVEYLAERYKNGEAVDIARLCDDILDRSGRQVTPDGNLIENSCTIPAPLGFMGQEN
jgi:hypothetical protein